MCETENRESIDKFRGVNVAPPRNYPYWSRAMGCPPWQIPEMQEALKAYGCSTEFHPRTGFAEIRSRQHFERLRKIFGLKDWDGYSS